LFGQIRQLFWNLGKHKFLKVQIFESTNFQNVNLQKDTFVKAKKISNNLQIVKVNFSKRTNINKSINLQKRQFE
jgi:hypothetical protein